MKSVPFKTQSLPAIEQLQVHDKDYAQMFFPRWKGDVDSIRFESTTVSGEKLLCFDLMLRAKEASFLVLAAYIDGNTLVLPSMMACAGRKNLTLIHNIVAAQLSFSPQQCEFRSLSLTPRIDPQVAGNGRALPGVCDYMTATNHLRRYLFLAELGLSGRVLECASGTGYGAAILARDTKIEEYLGVDLDTQAVAIAQGMVKSPRFRFVAKDLSEVEGQFNYVLSLETIEHVPNPFVFLRALQSKLNVDGTLIASIPAERWAGNHLNPDHLTNWTYQRVRRFFEAHFEEVDIRLQQLSLLGPTPLESAHIYERPFVESRDEDFVVIARRPKRFTAQTIVVKRTNAVGDILWVTPILAELRACNPDAFLVAMTRHTDVLLRNAEVDLIGTMDYQPDIDDRVINLDGAYERNRRQHILTAYAWASEVVPSRLDPIFSPYPDDLNSVGNLLKDRFSGSNVQFLIAIHAGATSPDRIWPATHWQDLIHNLLERPNVGVLIVGHNRDFDSGTLGVRQHPRVLDLVKRLNLSLSGAALAHCDLLVCVDSGLLHLATAVGTTSVALFGMARPATRLSFSLPSLGLVSPADCHGCLDELPPAAAPICKFGRGASFCMEMLAPGEVITALNNILEPRTGSAKWVRMLDLRMGRPASVLVPCAHRELVPDMGARSQEVGRRRKLVVCGMETPQSACPTIRLIAPFSCLPEEWELVWGIVNLEMEFETLRSADVILLHRFMPGACDLDTLKAIFKLGIPVIYETDDLLTEVPDNIPYADSLSRCKAGIEYAIQRANAVIVSTQFLADKYRPMNPNVHVLVNFLDFDRFYRPVPLQSPEKVSIGLVGTSLIPYNFALVDAALRTLCERYRGRIRLCFIGHQAPPGWESHPAVEYQPLLQGYHAYAEWLLAQQLDIALIPLADDSFNNSKSVIKWMEYSAAGVASVFSDVTTYRSVVDSGRNGLLVEQKPEAWLAAIESLIADPASRRQIARTAQAEVRKYFSLRENAFRYHRTYLHAIGAHEEASAVVVADEPARVPGVLVLDGEGSPERVGRSLRSIEQGPYSSLPVIVLTTQAEALPEWTDSLRYVPAAAAEYAEAVEQFCALADFDWVIIIEAGQ